MIETTFITLICNSFDKDTIEREFNKFNITKNKSDDKRLKLLKIRKDGYTGKNFQIKYSLKILVNDSLIDDSNEKSISSSDLAFNLMGTYFLCEKCLTLRKVNPKTSIYNPYCFKCRKFYNRKEI